MKDEKGKWSPLKKGIFIYLASSQIIRWVNASSGIAQSDYTSVGEAVLVRVLRHELVAVLCVVAFVLLDKFIFMNQSRLNIILRYAIGYVACVGAGLVYGWILNWFFAVNMGWMVFVGLNIGFVVCMVALNIKHHFIAKKLVEQNVTHFIEKQ